MFFSPRNTVSRWRDSRPKKQGKLLKLIDTCHDFWSIFVYGSERKRENKNERKSLRFLDSPSSFLTPRNRETSVLGEKRGVDPISEFREKHRVSFILDTVS